MQLTQHSSKTLFNLLGGISVLGSEPLDLQAAIHAGLPFKSYDLFVRTTALTLPEQAQLFGLALRSVNRLRADRKPLNPVASDRLVRMARLVGELLNLWHGDKARVMAWLRSPNTALNEKRPMELLDTDPGVRLVENVINGLKYGGFA